MPLSLGTVLTFAKFGINVIISGPPQDPTTEEEFLQIEYPEKPLVTWEQFRSEYENQKQIVAKKLLREHRDLLLTKSDWVMTADVFTTLVNKDDWISYRQSLRDLPQTITTYKWRTSDRLDFASMSIPVAPPVIRT